MYNMLCKALDDRLPGLQTTGWSPARHPAGHSPGSRPGATPCPATRKVEQRAVSGRTRWAALDVVATKREAGAARAPAPADLAARAALVLVRPALGHLPGPAHAGPHRAAHPAAEQPVVGRADPGEPADRAGRLAHPGADLAGQRRALVSGPHLALRPLWLCRACAAPWPCATARLTLLDEYADDRVALLVYLGGLLHDAAGELHTLNPHDGPEPTVLFHRFLGWALARPGRDRRATG